MKNPYFRSISLSFLFLSGLILAAGCKKSSTASTAITTVPTLTTTGLIINLTSTTAQSGGSISSAGDDTIKTNGVCYSATNKTPTTADSKTTDAVNNTSNLPVSFSSYLTGLTPNTVYYVRAYATNAAGTAYGSVVQFTTSSSISAVTATVSTLAGSGTPGYADGAGISALFNNPQGVTADVSGNLYVADSYNNLIRKITPDGTVSTIAGSGTVGYQDGPALTAQFYGPQALVADASGNLYVADFGNNVIRKISAAGVVSTFAGDGTAGTVNGTTTAAEFNNPRGLAFDASGNLYVADHGNNLIRMITPAGVVSTFAGTRTPGYVNATGTGGSFRSPNGIAVDAAGNIYVADQGNSAIRKITSAGVVTTIAGGPAQTNLINLPAALALDKQGNIYIADEGGRIMECTTANVLYILAGQLNIAGFTNGAGTIALFSNPQGITVDASGNVYVAEQGNNAIRKLVVKITP